MATRPSERPSTQLVDVLDGVNMPDTGWEEARNYNQALLMAAQVRADLADLLFRVWDASFGQANPSCLGEEYFNSEAASPAAIWRERYVERYYYRDGRPAEEDRRSDGLFVWPCHQRRQGSRLASSATPRAINLRNSQPTPPMAWRVGM